MADETTQRHDLDHMRAVVTSVAQGRDALHKAARAMAKTPGKRRDNRPAQWLHAEALLQHAADLAELAGDIYAETRPEGSTIDDVWTAPSE